MFDTPQPEVRAIFDAQKAAFSLAEKRSYEQRVADLDALEGAVRAHADEIAAAIDADFGCRPKQETVLGETVYILNDIAHTKKKLKSWMKPRRVGVDMNLQPGKAYVRREPLGVVGIMSPWNYPFQLAMAPLTAALAGGNRVMIKPAEATPETSALMGKMIAGIFKPDHVAVVEGGRETGEAFSSIPFDRLFFTGSTRVGRMVYQAAAANLTPVTLELGGKSPAFVGDDLPADKLAPMIGFGKWFNGGQTCVAPDYVLAPRARMREVADGLLAWVRESFGDPVRSEFYASQVSGQHYDRMKQLLEEVKTSGAEVLSASDDWAGADETRRFPPTLVLDPPKTSRLMEEEIFGPILPIVPYETLDEAIEFVNRGERPLALYAMFKDKAAARRVVDKTISGGVCVNGALLHLSVSELPFGGVGASGLGAYHGVRGFEEFTHARGVLELPVWHPTRMMKPPYDSFAYKFIEKKLTK